MALNTKLLDEVRGLLAEKTAFVPMPGGDPAAGGAPMDPAAGGMPPPGGDPAAMGGDPAAMGGAPMDPAAMGGAPMDPAAGGMPPMDPAAMGGMPPAPAPAPQSGLISMTAEELLKFIKQIVAICTNGKFGNDPKPTDGGPVGDGQAALNAKVDTIMQYLFGQQQG